jgi:hypothetical protein
MKTQGVYVMKRQRLSAAVVSLCLVGTLAAVPASAVDSGTALEAIRALGIMSGDSNGNLNLTSRVTRAEFVTMMTSASAYRDTIGSGYGVSLFKDVKSSHWASEYIKLAVEQGWVSGYVDGTFRPDQQITLEEGCSALLKLLGYDTGSLAGAYPYAQLSKAKAIGLLDDMTAVQGQALTRQDCVTLFYNLLVCSTNSGMTYGTSLGYTVTNGEINYATLVNSDTKGPYVAESSGSVSLPFSTTGATVYRNGSLSSLSAISRYDVYYYNANLRTVWVYNDRVTGTLTDLAPSQTAPTSATVAGVSYAIGTSTATYKLSSQGEFSQGDLVTLLLGMNGEVVDVVSAQASESTYYGVVVSSAKSASTSSTTSASTSSVQVATQVACSDGTVRTFYHSGGALSAGRLVTVSVTQSGTSVSGLSGKSMAGSVNSSGTTFAGYKFADDVEILDTTSSGGYARIYPSRLAGAKLTTSNVVYYSLDSSGCIDRLILRDATGDAMDYVYISSAQSSSSGLDVSASYIYYRNGQSFNVSGNVKYAVNAGGGALIYEDGKLKSMRQLASVNLDQLGSLTAKSGSTTYSLDEQVQVLLRDDSSASTYYATTLSQINTTDYTLKGWYDNLGYPAGGRIRIIIATKK